MKFGTFIEENVLVLMTQRLCPSDIAFKVKLRLINDLENNV